MLFFSDFVSFYLKRLLTETFYLDGLNILGWISVIVSTVNKQACHRMGYCHKSTIILFVSKWHHLVWKHELFINKLTTCNGCRRHDLCRKLCIAIDLCTHCRLMLWGMIAQYHTVKNKFFNFFFASLFTAEINGTTTRAMYQEFGLDLED